ncbi:hypothetical protein T12_305 [Trichinella patagoniensis]|uniref:Uncharacterized protein n=1 Tax=Trichinella patagoniensis TaxID=990121 RepID=A0A0V0Z799_9BILA|nr:hypothetical protein T12_305 [Trichinella patagoniensis]
MHAVDLQVQCNVVYAYKFLPHNNEKDKNIQVKGKEALRMEDWLASQAIPDTCPDGSTSPDMSGSAEFLLSC